MTRKILTLLEVAERTRIPLATLRYMRARGDSVPLWKLAGRIVAYEDDVERWLDQQYVSTVTNPPAA